MASPSTVAPVSWIQAAAANEVRIIDSDGSFPLRYKIHKIDAKGETTREVIESRDGGITRLLLRNNKPLTAEEDAAERARLQSMLDNPADFARHHSRDLSARSYSKQLVNLFPQAMLFTYTPGQPQSPGAHAPEVVIDFQPDPNFKPPTLVSDALTGIEGRVWIDAQSKNVVHVDGHIRHAVDFGWGFLARIYPGGSIQFEQTDTAGGHWAYSHLLSRLTIRELLFKTAQENTNLDYFDYQLLPQPLSWQDAVHQLLGEHVATR